MVELINLSDEQLMERFAKGDPACIEELLRRHRGPLYGYLLRTLGRPDLAEDAFQEVFLKIIKGAKRYKAKAKFKQWMYTIARNHCIDLSRRQKHRNTESLDRPAYDNQGESKLDQVASENPGPENGVLEKEKGQMLEQAIAGLEPDQKEVFLMREKLEMPFQEIADMVGIPINTAKSRMRYALTNLRKSLEAQGYWEERIQPDSR